jgi:thioredoxin-like negative regulator of GroEL
MSLVERLSVLANQHVGKFRIAFIDTSRETDIVNAFRVRC